MKRLNLGFGLALAAMALAGAAEPEAGEAAAPEATAAAVAAAPEATAAAAAAAPQETVVAPAAAPTAAAPPAIAAAPMREPAPARPAASAPAVAPSTPARFFNGFQAEILAGPVVGLERALRGGRFALGMGYAPRGLGLGARAGIDYDASFGAWIGQAELRLLFGPDLALGLGAELPFGDLLLLEPRSGARLALGPAAIPMRFSLETTAIELKPAPSRAKGGQEPRFFLAGELSWSAYRLLGATDGAGGPAPPLAGLLAPESGFAAGLRLGLCLRLAWTGQ